MQRAAALRARRGFESGRPLSMSPGSVVSDSWRTDIGYRLDAGLAVAMR